MEEVAHLRAKIASRIATEAAQEEDKIEDAHHHQHCYHWDRIVQGLALEALRQRTGLKSLKR